MWILWLVTAVWAASFSLIGEFLAGHVDGYIAVFIRMILALLVLLPWYRPRLQPWSIQLRLMAIGAIQIGLMYLMLYQAFLYLTVAEVLLFTIFTPLYITLIDELGFARRPLPLRWWYAALLAVIGAFIIRAEGTLSTNFLMGFTYIQVANLCFAAGQVFYKRLPLGDHQQQRQSFALFFAGATLVSGIALVNFADHSLWPSTNLQWVILVWLGCGASGLGYLAWNIGTKLVNTGQLATMNNMLIPAGLLINFTFWGQSVEWFRLGFGSTILLLSVWLASRQPRPASGG